MIRRKAIQLILTQKDNIVALCDDGTIWIKGDDWSEILPVPQDCDLEDREAHE